MNQNQSGIQISRRSFFSSLAVLGVLILLAGVLTLVIPAGTYIRAQIDGRETVLADTFEYIEGESYPVWRWFTAPIEVLWSDDAVTVIVIILFICVVGGTFSVLDKSGMLRYIMQVLVEKFSHRKYLLMAILVLFFMLFGSVFGIFEELVALVPIVVLLSRAMGWDSLVGLGMSALAAGFGFSAATLNPFTLGVAQELAGVPAFSGVGYRLLAFVLCYGVLYCFLAVYAKRLDKNAARSLVYAEDRAQMAGVAAEEDAPLENRAYLGKTVMVFTASLLLVICYIVAGFFLPALSSVSMPVMAVLFLVGGLAAAKVSGYGGNIWRDFVSGVVGIAPSAILILMAMSVKLIITNGKILDTILYYIVGATEEMGVYGAVVMVYLLVLLLNFFVSSGSAKAFLLIPILTPLADLVGLSHQVTVLAFCFGDGFTNLLYPTNALLVITLGLTVVSYQKWFRFTISLQLLMSLVNVGLLLFAVWFGY